MNMIISVVHGQCSKSGCFCHMFI